MLLTFVQHSNGRQKRQSSEISNSESLSECGPDPEPDCNGDGEASLRHTTHPQSQDVPKREINHEQISSGGDVGGAAKRLKSVDAHGEPGEEEEEGDGSSHRPFSLLHEKEQMAAARGRGSVSITHTHICSASDACNPLYNV
jgi:hypothetical protein